MERKKKPDTDVVEFFAIVVKVKSEDPAKTFREAQETLFKVPGVQEIIYRRRSADKLFIIPQNELDKLGIKVRP